MTKAQAIFITIAIALAGYFMLNDLTPSEVNHCLATSTDKSICKSR